MTGWSVRHTSNLTSNYQSGSVPQPQQYGNLSQQQPTDSVIRPKKPIAAFWELIVPPPTSFAHHSHTSTHIIPTVPLVYLYLFSPDRALQATSLQPAIPTSKCSSLSAPPQRKVLHERATSRKKENETWLAEEMLTQLGQLAITPREQEATGSGVGAGATEVAAAEEEAMVLVLLVVRVVLVGKAAEETEAEGEAATTPVRGAQMRTKEVQSSHLAQKRRC